MIKINLALKKQVAYAGGDSNPQGGTFASMKNFGSSADSGDLLGIVLRVFIPLILCVGLYFSYEYYIQKRVEEFGIELANVETEKNKVQSELSKIAGFEKQKEALDKIEAAINLKINTIEQLILGKDHTVKALIVLSQSLPKDVWVTDVSVSEKAINIRGNSLEMGLVSDVMVKLGSSVFFKNVSLKGSSLDATGKLAVFELTAGRE